MDNENTIANTYIDNTKNDDNILTTSPTLPIIKLYFMCQDIYENNYNLYFRQMTNNISKNYTDKFDFLDKIIMLIYGVNEIRGYKVMKETLPIDRFDVDSLKESEKLLQQLETPVVFIDTDVGQLIIGYDYAQILPPKLEPSIGDKTQHEIDQEKYDFDINYPIIKIDIKNSEIRIEKVSDTRRYYIQYKEYRFTSIFESSLLDTSSFEEYIDNNIEDLKTMCDDLVFQKSVKNNECIVYIFSLDDNIVQHIYYYNKQHYNYDIIYPNGIALRSYFMVKPQDNVDEL